MKKKASGRRLWWAVHQWVGLKLSLFLAFILFTGTLAVLSAEIDWLLHPTLRVSPSSVDGPPRWDLIAENSARYPGVATINYIARPTARAFAVRVAFQRADESRGYLHVHPTTGKVQGEQSFVDAQRVLRNLHRHLNLPVKYGIPIVCSLAILLLISLVTSFVVYRKWWRGFFKPIRWRDVRTAWGDFHRLAGVWSLWFVALIALTGLWYLVEQLGGEAPGLPEPTSEVAALPSGAAATSAADRLAVSLAAARRADPTLVVESVQFPDEKSGAFVFQGQRSAWLVRPRANAIWVDGASARVVMASDGGDLGVHQRISEMADPLHFGTFAGYWTRIPWFLFGLLMTGLALSGAAIYSHRIAHSARVAVARRPIMSGVWLGMGDWRWLSLILVITGGVMIGWMFYKG
ncbi:PepSY-associated TM helix domain-containing protein [Sphingopyxis sp.]|uniref:PepSY-associated TM helix domain-containing protein n=1 Tax=Sphingopyxis sp. TaxID=1908224 RepID=UPI002D7900A9|nr:PepSY-associated TM helix domain-containing protein [Sphingopyxis sp.]HET6524460.1 PepSY-associated TM helix domain-containing protein [Sphingopyxis sp.]